jgi:hypothetical protein
MLLGLSEGGVCPHNVVLWAGWIIMEPWKRGLWEGKSANAVGRYGRLDLGSGVNNKLRLAPYDKSFSRIKFDTEVYELLRTLVIPAMSDSTHRSHTKVWFGFTQANHNLAKRSCFKTPTCHFW